jgi:CHASE3 domain sensor protein
MEPTRPTEDGFFVRNATQIAIGVVTILMLMPILMFWRQSLSNEVARQQVLHTYEVITHIEMLMGKIKEANLGQRGFLVTANPDFLEPYENAMRDAANLESGQRSLLQNLSIPQELALLRKLTA